MVLTEDWPWWIMKRRNYYWKNASLGYKEASGVARYKSNTEQEKIIRREEWLKCPGEIVRACSVWRGMKSEGSPVSSEGVWVLGREERKDNLRRVTLGNHSSNYIWASEQYMWSQGHEEGKYTQRCFQHLWQLTVLILSLMWLIFQVLEPFWTNDSNFE